MNTSLKYFLILFFILFSISIFGQESLWSFVHETGLIGVKTVESPSIKKYKTVRLNELEFFNRLQTRATRQYDLQNTAFRIEFPDTNGELETFSVIETSILHPVLAKKFPGIKSYKGVGAEDQWTLPGLRWPHYSYRRFHYFRIWWLRQSRPRR